MQQNQLLPPGGHVIAAVSGGADSLALLLLLDRLREGNPFRLSAAHLNHGLRGTAADEDEAFVRCLCEQMGIPFFSRRIDLTALAAQHRQGIEETGRQSRLAFFHELADTFEAKEPGIPVRIALAHHQDDQAETILLHLGRGTGLDGLVGMKPANGRLIRPFLAASRREIEAWLTGQEFSWRHDETNEDLFALRNRIRHGVLPAWRDALGYDPAPMLCRSAASLAEDQALLDSLARDGVDRLITQAGLSVSGWLESPPSLQNRILRLFWQRRTGSGRDLSRAHTMALRAWLPGAVPGQHVCLPGRWLARRAQGGVLEIVRDDRRQTADGGAPPAPVRLNLPGVTAVMPWNVEIKALFIVNESQIVYNDAMEVFWLDRLEGCVARAREPGDFVRPFGRSGGKTLKKYLNEQKIPPEQRARLLVIAKGSDIVWIPGMSAGAAFVARSPAGRPVLPGSGARRQMVRLECLFR